MSGEPPKFTYTRNVGDVILRFDWWGGEYIEVRSVMPAGKANGELINVWNPSTDHPRIARTQKALEDKANEWVEQYPRDALIHDVQHNW